MKIISIDCGLHGAWSTFNNKQVEVIDTPIQNIFVGRKKNKAGVIVDKYKNIYREQYIINSLKEAKPDIVVLELQNARITDGSVQAYRTGYGYGFYKGILQALEIKFIEVSPQKWKRALKLTSDKELSRKLAIKLFPQFHKELKRVQDEGRAESLLLGHWYKEHYSK